MAGHDIHRAELTHGAGIAQDDTIQQTPFDIRHCHTPEKLPAVGPEAKGGDFLLGPDSLHDRHQLASNKRARDECRSQYKAWRGKDDLEIMFTEPRSEVSLQTKQEDEDQACHDWRDGKGKVNKRGENSPARELIPRNGPGCCHAEGYIEDYGDGRYGQRQQDRVTRVCIR